MDTKSALAVFDSLSQETRLKIFQQLMRYGKEGLPAGEIASQLKVAHNTLSFHLQHLSRAGLVKSRKKGRSVIYSANITMPDKIIGFLLKNCCVDAGDNEKCAPLKPAKAKAAKAKSACKPGSCC